MENTCFSTLPNVPISIMKQKLSLKFGPCILGTLIYIRVRVCAKFQLNQSNSLVYYALKWKIDCIHTPHHTSVFNKEI